MNELYGFSISDFLRDIPPSELKDCRKECLPSLAALLSSALHGVLKGDIWVVDTWSETLSGLMFLSRSFLGVCNICGLDTLFSAFYASLPAISSSTTSSSTFGVATDCSSIALTCSRLVSIESLGVCSLLSFTGLAAGFLSLTTALPVLESLVAAFTSLVESLALIGALAVVLAPAAGAASTFLVLSVEAYDFLSVAAVSLSLSFSASELVKFLSNDEPFVTINF